MAELATDDANRGKLVARGELGEPEDGRPTSRRMADDIGSRFTLPAEFVVPGQNRVAAALDVARTVVRRAERSAAAVAAERVERRPLPQPAVVGPVDPRPVGRGPVPSNPPAVRQRLR